MDLNGEYVKNQYADFRLMIILKGNPRLFVEDIKIALLKESKAKSKL